MAFPAKAATISAGPLVTGLCNIFQLQSIQRLRWNHQGGVQRARACRHL